MPQNAHIFKPQPENSHKKNSSEKFIARGKVKIA